MAQSAFVDSIYQLRPWYHDFSRLGIQTIFPDTNAPFWKDITRNLYRILRGQRPYPRGTHRSDHFVLNQRCKEQELVPMLETVFQALPQPAHGLDLFCADGYYSFLMTNIAPRAQVVGVDLNEQDIHRATMMAQVLKTANATFETMDVFDMLREPLACDFIFCAGGLYHLAAPADLIHLIGTQHPKRVVIQSVVSLDREDENYFVTPAPGWKHGSRFSHARLRNWILESGLEILAERRNELEGNPRKQDRGSSYFLCAS